MSTGRYAATSLTDHEALNPSSQSVRIYCVGRLAGWFVSAGH
jgi:hypothetical protein